MGNFKKHNKSVFDYKISSEDYWDFHLALDSNDILKFNNISEQCLSAYIDISNPFCVLDDNTLKSLSQYYWDNAYNYGLKLENIGMTGVDNGLFHYDKNEITNTKFQKIFFESTYELEENDFSLYLHPVYGNNQIYNYNFEIKDGVAKLNGGFFQGFFKDGDNVQYQVLPHIIEDGWQLEITLKKENFKREGNTLRLNDHYPENKGIFLFIGVRSENKWWNFYRTGADFESSLTDYFDQSYIDDSYFTMKKTNDTEYFAKTNEIVDENYISDDYIDGYNYKKSNEPYIVEGYFENDYAQDKEIVKNGEYVDDYIENDTKAATKSNMITKNGFDVRTNDEILINTDNKFILFNRTKDGFTTCNWSDNEKNTSFTIQMEKKPDVGNYFTLFDRTENGYTTCNIDTLLEQNKNKYNIENDLKNNAIAFQIDDEGYIGYKIIVKDCENNTIRTETEFSKHKLIEEGKWYTISIKILPMESQAINKHDCSDLKSNTNRTMKILFYVNGYLKFVSKELPILNLRQLNTMYEKQEGIPYNLSLGGGTQGLCDTVSIDYMTTPKDVLFMEKNFAGTFIGYIKEFKFYSCPQNLSEIRANLN